MTNYPKGAKLDKVPHPYALLELAPQTLEPSLSYEYAFDGVDNQGQENDCVANATAALFEFFAWKRRSQRIEVSRQAIYTQGKTDNPGNEDMADDGLYVTDGLKVLEQHGYVNESAWPYDAAHLLRPVPADLWNTDFELQAFAAVDVASTHAMKAAMVARGPLGVGLDWAAQWEDGVGADGFLPEPSDSAGGHCVLLVGYSDHKRAFRGRNSWGEGWGDGGYFWLPYAYHGTSFWPSEAYTVRA